MIIAMPNNQVVHRSDPKHTELTFTLFEKELRTHIVPLVEQTYSVAGDPHGRAIAGLSMGGRHAQLVGFKCLDLFAVVRHPERGDPESEKSAPEFLNDPQINTKVDYLFVGLGTAREPADEPQRRVPPDPREARRSSTTTTSAATAATTGRRGGTCCTRGSCPGCGARNGRGRRERGVISMAEAVAVVVVILLRRAPAWAQSYYTSRLVDPKAVHLETFGARGDGVADDTDAIQRAIDRVAGDGRPGHRLRAARAATG